MIEITDFYQKHENENELKFDYDKKHPQRPVWVRVLNRPKGVRFLSVKTNKYPEIIYRSFGDYFYPIDQTTKEGKMFIDAIAKDYDAIVSKNNLFLAKYLVKKLERLNLSKNTAVIDLGAGTGIVSSILSRQSYKNLTLFDYSEKMLAIAKLKPELETAKFIIGDVTKNLPNKKFGLIVSVMLFDYFDNKTLKETLKKWADRLENSGVIAIIEDAGRTPFKDLFDMIEEGTVKVNGMEKYYFIGRKKK